MLQLTVIRLPRGGLRTASGCSLRTGPLPSSETLKESKKKNKLSPRLGDQNDFFCGPFFHATKRSERTADSLQGREGALQLLAAQQLLLDLSPASCGSASSASRGVAFDTSCFFGHVVRVFSRPGAVSFWFAFQQPSKKGTGVAF